MKRHGVCWPLAACGWVCFALLAHECELDEGPAAGNSSDTAGDVSLEDTVGESDLGTACTAGAECSSGICADGVCCDTSCASTCKTCNLPGLEGTCEFVPDGFSHTGNCPAPHTCDGAGKCLLPNGELCLGGAKSAGDCASGFCVDLYCCNSACGAMCMQCDVPGSEGSCTNVPAGGVDPDGCFSPDKCDGNGKCVKKPPAPNGTPCANGQECSSGFCTDGVCCNKQCDGVCNSCSAAKKSSGPDGWCGDSKNGTNENDCPSTAVCWAGKCKLPQGYPCVTNAECYPWWACRDGVCCDNTFCAEGNQICTACTQAKTGQPDGRCATVFADTDPFDSCQLPGATMCVGPTKPGSCK